MPNSCFQEERNLWFQIFSYWREVWDWIFCVRCRFSSGAMPFNSVDLRQRTNFVRPKFIYSLYLRIRSLAVEGLIVRCRLSHWTHRCNQRKTAFFSRTLCYMKQCTSQPMIIFPMFFAKTSMGPCVQIFAVFTGCKTVFIGAFCVLCLTNDDMTPHEKIYEDTYSKFETHANTTVDSSWTFFRTSKQSFQTRADLRQKKAHASLHFKSDRLWLLEWQSSVKSLNRSEFDEFVKNFVKTNSIGSAHKSLILPAEMSKFSNKTATRIPFHVLRVVVIAKDESKTCFLYVGLRTGNKQFEFRHFKSHDKFVASKWPTSDNKTRPYFSFQCCCMIDMRKRVIVFKWQGVTW